MSFYIISSLVTSIIASVILVILTINFVYRALIAKIEHQTSKNMCEGNAQQSTLNELEPTIKLNVILILITFTLVAVVHTIMYAIYTIPQYQTNIYEERLLYIIGMRGVPMSLLYVFFYQRLYYIFKDSIFALNNSFYIKGLIIGLSIYWIWVVCMYAVMILIIEYNILTYKSVYLCVCCILITGTEMLLSSALVFIAVKRLNKLNNQTSTANKIDDPNDVIKYATKKIFVLTMTATISTQILMVIYGSRTGFTIDVPCTIEVNIDAVVNALCVILSLNYYKKEYNKCCFFVDKLPCFCI